MKNEMYLVAINWVNEDGEDGQEHYLFKEYEEAQKKFTEIVDECKHNDHLFDNDVEDLVIEDLPYYFLVYRKGEYRVDHYEVKIETLTVR